ncbi:MAG: DUF3445 domain-containing protein [Paracoccaceae bacterium]
MSRLPGMQPFDLADWLIRDDAFDAQMGLRDRLIRERRGAIVRLADSARPAATALLEEVLDALSRAPDYVVSARQVVRPDAVVVALDRDDPMGCIGRLAQEDFCLLEKPDGAPEHVLSGAVLCFPAGWTLDEKFMRPLRLIHRPVAPYDDNVARRVQRLFDAIRPERPIWRANGLFYDDPGLFAPHREADERPEAGVGAPYLRAERQCLRRLKNSPAVVFSIHTFMVRRADLSAAQARATAAYHAAGMSVSQN